MHCKGVGKAAEQLNFQKVQQFAFDTWERNDYCRLVLF